VPVRHRPEPDQDQEEQRVDDHGVRHREEPGRAGSEDQRRAPATKVYAV
jgi:hypothetical protein